MDLKCSQLTLNGIALGKMCWQFLVKFNIHSPYDQPSSLTPGNLPLINEDLCSYKNAYMNVYSLTLFVIAKKLETTHVSLNRRMAKQTVLHPSQVTPLSNKNQ